MIQKPLRCLNIRKLIKFQALILILVFLSFPQLTTSPLPVFIMLNEDIQPNKSFDDFSSSNTKNDFQRFRIDELSQDNPEAMFPNFLFYSIEVANLMIEGLYDNDSDGFYISTGSEWQRSTIDENKRSYDNAQAILAMLKLSEAVLTEKEKNFALNIAIKTCDGLFKNFYDQDNGGFYISSTNEHKKPGILGKIIQALLALYETTGNNTYQSLALETFNFLDSYGWNEQDGYYYYLLSKAGVPPSLNPDEEDPFDPKAKRVDHNMLMGEALLDLYRVEKDSIYLEKAVEIYNYFNQTLRFNVTSLYFDGMNSVNNVVGFDSDIFVNSLVLEFTARIYNATQNSAYLQDFYTVLYAVMNYFWDNFNGGFYASYSYLGDADRDPKKYTERQFYAIRALDEAFRLSGNEVFYNLILDVFEFLNTYLYDKANGGYNQLVNNDGGLGDPSWKNKFTITNSLSIFALSDLWLYSKPGVLNALWSPSTPRHLEPVTISAAAFDADGVSNVYINYSIDQDEYEVKTMDPHSLVGNMFVYNFASQEAGTSVNFNIIVNDTLGNKAVRGSYYFKWQYDIWEPHITQIAFDPGMEIPLDTKFTITVSAQDTPVQGEVDYVRIFYHGEDGSEITLALKQIDSSPHLWTITFNEGMNIPGLYSYYFEAIDNRGNFGYTVQNTFRILGHLNKFPFESIIGLFFIILVIIPAGIYTYVEYKKRGAKSTLKRIKTRKDMKRRGKRRKRKNLKERN